MILLARGLARLATFLLLVALTALGGAAAAGSISSGTGDVSLPGFARLLELDRLSNSVGGLLDQLAAPGPIALLTALGAAAAIAVGVLLLVGLLWPRRERLFVLARDGDGTLAARRRSLRQVAAALTAEVEGVGSGRVRVRPARRGRAGGRVRVRVVAQTRETDAGAVREGIERQLAPITDYGVASKVRVRRPRGR